MSDPSQNHALVQVFVDLHIICTYPISFQNQQFESEKTLTTTTASVAETHEDFFRILKI